MSDRRQRLTALRRGAWALVVAFVAWVGGGEVFTNQAHAGTPDNVFVCKYVGTPGVDERLQTGDNPIRVSVSSIPAGAALGAFFADEQGRSVVLAFDVGQAEPDVSECPA